MPYGIIRPHSVNENMFFFMEEINNCVGDDLVQEFIIRCSDD